VEKEYAPEIASQTVFSHQSVDGPEVTSEDIDAEVSGAVTTEDHPPTYREANMLKRIVAIAVVLVLGYLGYLGFSRYKADRDVAAGEVVSEDAGHMDLSPENESSRLAHGPQPLPISPVGNSLVASKSDTVPPNPPNGQAFTGTGKFQVYRQGNITWRVNTESGESCILLATQEEWRKPIVYSHGCNPS